MNNALLTEQIQTPLVIAKKDGKPVISKFDECSYYNGDKPANIGKLPFQLRRALPGGNGYFLLSEHATAEEALASGRESAPNFSGGNLAVFDVSAFVC